ncbi:MAG: hypothetical protein LBS11_09040 [Oscillospiraceae bacterium]|jgi:hypothetical protein|nr:hypothetical protein [Oscillospiraceae bacterium]
MSLRDNGRPNRFRNALILALALAASGFLGMPGGIQALNGAALAGENIDPITANIEIQPVTLSGPQTVRVSIQIMNVGDDDIPGSVVLIDPANNRVSTFGSGGSLQMRIGQQFPWVGEWTVTKEQLETGSITYKLQYPRIVDGTAQNITKNLTARFTYNKPVNHKLNVQRSYTPTNPEEGQTVTMEYLFENTGDVNLLDLYIMDKGVGINKKGDLLIESLSVGASVTKSWTFKMGAATVSSQPTIYYTPEGLGKSVSGTVSKVITITPTKIDITATLTTSKDVVNRGDSVSLVCEIKNAGSVSYKEITISDASLGVIAQNISLGAKKTYKETKTVKVSAPGAYKFDITGVDANGNPLALSSNEVTVQTREDAKPVSLSISIESDRDVIYTDPATAVFIITTRNTGEETTNEIVVSAAGKNIYTIPQLKPGEQDVRAKEFTLFMGGTFQFTATAKNSLGEAAAFKSNEVPIVYQAPKPTPSPTPTITPTPTPAQTATPQALVTQSANLRDSGSFGSVLLWVMGGLLVLILAGAGAMFILDRQRAPAARSLGSSRSPAAVEVIDHLDRSPRRDYSRAAKNAARNTLKAAGLPVLAKAFSKRRDDADNADVTDIDNSRYAPPTAADYAPSYAGMDDAEDEFIEPEIASLNGDEPDGRYLEPDDTHRIDAAEIARAAERYAPPRNAGQEPETEAKPNKPDAEPDPEAGGAGQYRLTRRAGTLRPKTEKPLAVESEDPASFAKKQRARRSREINTAQFYEED